MNLPVMTDDDKRHAAKTRKQRNRYDELAVYFAFLTKRTSNEIEARFYDNLRQVLCDLERNMFVSGER